MTDVLDSNDISFTGNERDELPGDMTVPSIGGPTCEVCGTQLTYAGKGRKPKFCDEHKPGKSNAKRIPQARNAALAAQAAEILANTNSLVAFVATMASYTDTADAIKFGNDEFKRQAYEALLSDPELCKSITRGGAVTGRMALIMAYAMFSFSVVPVAYNEVKEKRATRAVESGE